MTLTYLADVVAHLTANLVGHFKCSFATSVYGYDENDIAAELASIIRMCIMCLAVVAQWGGLLFGLLTSLRAYSQALKCKLLHPGGKCVS